MCVKGCFSISMCWLVFFSLIWQGIIDERHVFCYSILVILMYKMQSVFIYVSFFMTMYYFCLYQTGKGAWSMNPFCKKIKINKQIALFIGLSLFVVRVLCLLYNKQVFYRWLRNIHNQICSFLGFAHQWIAFTEK